jgi:predicted lipase
MKFFAELAQDAYSSNLTREGYSVKFYDRYGSQAYLLTNDQHQIIVFRGTDEPKDLRSIAKSHEGFMRYAFFLLAKIPVDSEKKLILTGHSLGGAVAICFAALTKHKNVEIITFGCPKVGSKEFVNEIRHIPHKRYVNVYDYVPYLPLFACHHGNEVRLPNPSIRTFFQNHHVDFYVKMMEKSPS